MLSGGARSVFPSPAMPFMKVLQVLLKRVLPLLRRRRSWDARLVLSTDLRVGDVRH